ncbi:ribosome hibernation-promoting factor, HPF/YfiA family [Desulfohalovibrio reitneri]|uniref:ribosome hibernation-promoting factor, HPF/YfiA family n=1 Tax=Desulfohalovibrio reitneri TaxID=1307759 RepID=UPI0004A7419C|nr:ribosome-associated translation inhibitor RaiA [Desulfohalovibrio reitneri]
MNIAFNFMDFEPSDHLKEYAHKRFGKLEKLLTNSDGADVQVNLSVQKRVNQTAEVVVSDDNLYISASEQTADMYSTIDLVLDKVLTQIKKLRDKQKMVRRPAKTEAGPVDVAPEPEEAERRIVRADSFQPKPMDEEEAAMQLESLDYDFLVFRNAETSRINVIYRRHDGDFGLIDPAST